MFNKESQNSVAGFCDEQFFAVKKAFEENFSSREEVGASISVVYNDKIVVDLWGGHLDAEKKRPWAETSLCTVWSLGKAVTALCALQLVDKNLIELDNPVADYWPEFSNNDKNDITVRHLLSHRAGLPALQELPPSRIWQDNARFVEMLAKQKAWWPAGERHGYHVHTFASLVGELVRRVSGQPLSEYCQENVAEPLGIDFYFSNDELVDERIADNIWAALNDDNKAKNNLPEFDIPKDDQRRRQLFTYMPSLDFDKNHGINSRAWRAANFPSTSSHSNARSLARIFGVLANDGVYLDRNGETRSLLRAQTILAARQIEANDIDATIGKPTRFGLGFMLTSPERPWGPNPGCFGHYGNNGLLGFADPDANIGFAYTMNRQGRAWRDPRNIALVDALYTCI
jgi:CubicO group peptidase (beta-lactamase class C family)